MPIKINKEAPLGIDFVGYMARLRYTVPRRKTIRRIRKKLEPETDLDKLPLSLDSYLGYLSHVDSSQLSEELKEIALRKLS